MWFGGRLFSRLGGFRYLFRLGFFFSCQRLWGRRSLRLLGRGGRGRNGSSNHRLRAVARFARALAARVCLSTRLTLAIFALAVLAVALARVLAAGARLAVTVTILLAFAADLTSTVGASAVLAVAHAGASSASAGLGLAAARFLVARAHVASAVVALA